MKMRCPRCGVSGSVDDAYMGRTLSCPKCNSRFKAVPEMTLVQPRGAEPAQDSEIVSRQDPPPPPDPMPEAAIGLDKAEGAVPAETGQAYTPAAAAVGTPLVSQQAEEIKEQAEAYTAESLVAKPVSGDEESDQGLATVEQTRRAEPAETESVGQRVELPIVDTLKEAWRLTNGVKGSIWAALLVNGLIVGLIDGAISGFTSVMPPESKVAIIIALIARIGSMLISVILTAGLIYMGVKRCRDEVVAWKDLFSGFAVAGRVIVTWLMSIILIFIGYLLLILPGIYLTVGYTQALLLVVDKRMPPWQALETSRKAIHKVWWKYFALLILMLLITLIAAIPLGIGLIWVAPMGVVLCGVVYKRVFSEDVSAG